MTQLVAPALVAFALKTSFTYADRANFQVRFLGDPTVKFTKALDLAWDGTAIFGGERAKRFVLEVEDGKVTAVHVEPDNTGFNGMFLLRSIIEDESLLPE